MLAHRGRAGTLPPCAGTRCASTSKRASTPEPPPARERACSHTEGVLAHLIPARAGRGVLAHPDPCWHAACQHGRWHAACQHGMGVLARGVLARRRHAGTRCAGTHHPTCWHAGRWAAGTRGGMWDTRERAPPRAPSVSARSRRPRPAAPASAAARVRALSAQSRTYSPTTHDAILPSDRRRAASATRARAVRSLASACSACLMPNACARRAHAYCLGGRSPGLGGHAPDAQ